MPRDDGTVPEDGAATDSDAPRDVKKISVEIRDLEAQDDAMGGALRDGDKAIGDGGMTIGDGGKLGIGGSPSW